MGNTQTHAHSKKCLLKLVLVLNSIRQAYQIFGDKEIIKAGQKAVNQSQKLSLFPKLPKDTCSH
jgi:hypothetical protein